MRNCIMLSLKIVNTKITVGAKEQPVYRDGWYDVNIYFLKYCCLVKMGCCLTCLVKKG